MQADEIPKMLLYLIRPVVFTFTVHRKSLARNAYFLIPIPEIESLGLE